MRETGSGLRAVDERRERKVRETSDRRGLSGQNVWWRGSEVKRSKFEGHPLVMTCGKDSGVAEANPKLAKRETHENDLLYHCNKNDHVLLTCGSDQR